MKITTSLKWLLVLVVLSLGYLTAMGQVVDTNSIPTTPPVGGVTLPDPTGFLTFLTGKFPWIAGILTWVLMLRLIAKPISGWLQGLATKALLYVQGTPETDDDAWVENILKSKAYRIVAFLVDWATSIKLPTSASIKQVQSPAPDISKPVVGALLACCMLTGCVTTDIPLETRVENKAAALSQIAVQHVLAKKPEAKPKIVLALDSLKVLQGKDVVGVAEVIAIIQQLPPDAFGKDTGIYIQDGIILFQSDLESYAVKNPAVAKAAVNGMVTGVSKGLGL